MLRESFWSIKSIKNENKINRLKNFDVTQRSRKGLIIIFKRIKKYLKVLLSIFYTKYFTGFNSDQNLYRYLYRSNLGRRLKIAVKLCGILKFISNTRKKPRVVFQKYQYRKLTIFLTWWLIFNKILKKSTLTLRRRWWIFWTKRSDD